jgi:hypothetical protein
MESSMSVQRWTWDVYRTDSLKEATREKRGKGVRRKVSKTCKLPKNHADFLRDSNNKQELFALLTDTVSSSTFDPSKEVYITSGKANYA